MKANRSLRPAVSPFAHRAGGSPGCDPAARTERASPHKLRRGRGCFGGCRSACLLFCWLDRFGNFLHQANFGLRRITTTTQIHRLNTIYLADSAVDDRMDAGLRGLLSVCFSDPCFATRRFCHEMPAHRWILREDTGGRLVAHVAAHDKVIGVSGGDLRVLGIAEVCVHPDQRGRGHVRALLSAAHKWGAENGFPFAMLFGRAEVYAGSGYMPAANAIRRMHGDGSWQTGPMESAMFRPLAEKSPPWPGGGIDLRGPLF